MQYGTLHLAVAGLSGPSPCHHNNIVSAPDPVPVQTKYLPDQPGDMVTDDTVAYFFTYGYPDSVSRGVILPDYHHQQAIGPGRSSLINNLEILILL